MRTTEVNFSDRIPVDGYAPGGFRIAGRVCTGPMIVFPDGSLLQWNGLPDLSDVLEQKHQTDVLIIGMGQDVSALSEDFISQRKLLETNGIGVEIMNTPSACRTYNVLLAEGRRVAAALMPV